MSLKSIFSSCMYLGMGTGRGSSSLIRDTFFFICKAMADVSGSGKLLVLGGPLGLEAVDPRGQQRAASALCPPLRQSLPTGTAIGHH